MAKFRRWTDDDTQHGRTLLQTAFQTKDRAKLEEYYAWLSKNVYVDVAVVRATNDLMFKHFDTQRALKIYDRMLANYSPRLQKIASTLVFIILAAAIVGGLRALFRSGP